MQFTQQEMNQLAAASTSSSRENLYAGIHKALRAFMTDTLLAVGRADPSDPQDVADASGRVIGLMDLCEAHVQHENSFVHPAIEARTPGVCGEVAQDHVAHLHHIQRLRAAAQQLPGLDAPLQAGALHALYLELSLFVADNLQHMHVEEMRHNAALWSAYTDAELRAIHDALVATIPPGEMMQVMRWMLPQMHALERLQVLGGMRQGAPAPVFQAVLDVVQPHLSPRDWAKLTQGLGLPAVPGLVAAV
ncbi:MAG: hemerythrin domain-containing protein [Hydrogenophaga sp.]|uniref:hemerythrin domain-containing protein n=1 Tax=Hydrogenophaga sp. TaxID=1904254 RepID=UPI0027292544|nr:hemerythrin domain-containing protein [Hydrogenophaga sp.]MDO9033078.1 hemerythrin domain-containing protein [Hydrogenophaga sp.]MDP2019452.1 hemerythrin domain-containing protein [Hydrogenophaga sp.]